MPSETNSRLEEVGVSLDLLGSRCQRVLIVSVESLKRVRGQSLVGKYYQQPVLLKRIDLRDLIGIEDASWPGRLIFGPSICQVYSAVGSIDEFATAIRRDKTVDSVVDIEESFTQNGLAVEVAVALS